MSTESPLPTAQQPLVAVLVIEHVAHAVPMAEALLSGGIDQLEVTLRTPSGLEAIAAIKEEVPLARVGAGTVCTPQQVHDAIAAGADFIVSPGATDALLETAAQQSVPFVPGAVTGSEVMRAMAFGFTTLKFFPAESSGGVAVLKAFSGPFPEVRFMPTGGITLDKLHQYLSLDNVLAVGGSWLTPHSLISDQNWEGIAQLAREAAAVTQSLRSGSAVA